MNLIFLCLLTPSVGQRLRRNRRLRPPPSSKRKARKPFFSKSFFTPEFLDLFNKYSEIYSDLANSEYRDMFCIGFRLGVKIMVDVYTVDDGVVSDPHID